MQQQQQQQGEAPAASGVLRGEAYLQGLTAGPAGLRDRGGGPLVVVAVAICGCISAVCLFTLIFTLLQQRSLSRSLASSDGYKKLEKTPRVRFKSRFRGRASRQSAPPAATASEVEPLGASVTLYSGDDSDDSDADADELDDASAQLVTRT